MLTRENLSHFVCFLLDKFVVGLRQYRPLRLRRGRTVGVGSSPVGFPLGGAGHKPELPLDLHIFVVGELAVDAVEPRPLRWGNTAGGPGRGLAVGHIHRHGVTPPFFSG